MSKKKFNILTQFDTGFGSARREHNIKTIAKMLRDGIPEAEIRRKLGLWFRPHTIDDYVAQAKILLEDEGGEIENEQEE
ncbi:MAG: hypothetical protein QXP16_03885 [Candidatus Bathyarchaeia archaeon]